MNPAADIIGQFQILHQNWYPPLFNIASDLFMSLAIIEMALAAIFWALQSRGIEDIATGLCKKLLWIGGMYALLLNADLWIPTIFDSFAIAGQRAAHIQSLSPGDVFISGLGIGLQMFKEMLGWGLLKNFTGALVGNFCALVIIVSFAWIATQMGLVLIKSYLAIGAGVLFLGFAPFRGTSSISERYLSGTIGLGVQLFLTYLVIGAGQLFAVQWAQAINQTTMLDAKTPLTIAFGAFMFATIAHNIPRFAGEMTGGVLTLGLGEIMSAGYSATKIATSAGQKAIDGGSAAGRRIWGAGSSLANAARSSGASGGGNGANNGPVPKLNSKPAK